MNDYKITRACKFTSSIIALLLVFVGVPLLLTNAHNTLDKPQEWKAKPGCHIDTLKWYDHKKLINRC